MQDYLFNTENIFAEKESKKKKKKKKKKRVKIICFDAYCSLLIL
jgi:hypothetical protein